MDICAEERRGAELDYLKRYGSEWIKSGGSVVESSDPSKPCFVKVGECFARSHPTFRRLCDKYGPPEAGETKVDFLCCYYLFRLVSLSVAFMTQESSWFYETFFPVVLNTPECFTFTAKVKQFCDLPAHVPHWFLSTSFDMGSFQCKQNNPRSMLESQRSSRTTPQSGHIEVILSNFNLNPWFEQSTSTTSLKEPWVVMHNLWHEGYVQTSRRSVDPTVFRLLALFSFLLFVWYQFVLKRSN